MLSKGLQNKSNGLLMVRSLEPKVDKKPMENILHPQRKYIDFL